MALVMRLAPARNRQLELRPATVIEVDLQGNERHAITLNSGVQFRQLARVHKQLARTAWRMIEPVGCFVDRDIAVDEVRPQRLAFISSVI